MKNRIKAFTLIELLIVVAIIAILAAIAVPNFLEAQTRAKAGRVYADFRSMATAIESYCVDNNGYPDCLQGTGDYAQGFPFRLHTISTPIAYMTKVPSQDPFRPSQVNSDSGLAYTSSFEYYDVKGASVRGGGDFAIATAFMVCGGQAVIVPGQPGNSTATPPWAGLVPKWLLLSVGPDGYEAFQWPILVQQDWNNNLVFYDPTNGTISKGDIYRSQARSSFQ